ncbi:MAG: hypothetical protein KDN22_01185, partial [Verrucomicrobiae bacterium]|nr:hypothetical protein [Verrucomicrobiae bacterium]
MQAGEPTVGETALHQRTVWWRWTAPDDAFVWVSVQPTLIIDGDTFSLSVFPAHSSVDIAGRGRAEKRFNFRAIAGEQYRIALARGLESTPANQQIRPEALGTDVTLHIASFVATAGDSYASRIDLGNATHVMVEGHTYFATSDPDDPVTSPETVWWTWEARYTGLAILQLSSPQPGVLSDVFVGRGSRRDDSVTLSSDIWPYKGGLGFWAEAGNSYQICVGTSSEGQFSFTLHLPSDPYTRAISEYPGLAPIDVAADADPQGEGISNLLRMALGIDPRIPVTEGANSGRQLKIRWDGEDLLIQCGIDATFVQAAGIVFAMEYSTNAIDWWRLRDPVIQGETLVLRASTGDIESLQEMYFRVTGIPQGM